MLSHSFVSGSADCQVQFWTAREESDTSFLVLNRAGKCLRLNHVAMHILMCLSDSVPSERLAQKVQDRYRIDEMTADRVVNSALEQLAIASLIVRTE